MSEEAFCAPVSSASVRALSKSSAQKAVCPHAGFRIVLLRLSFSLCMAIPYRISAFRVPACQAPMQPCSYSVKYFASSIAHSV